MKSLDQKNGNYTLAKTKSHGLPRHSSSFKPTPSAVRVLRSGRIIDSTETPHQMIERVVDTIGHAEIQFGASKKEIKRFMAELGDLLDHKKGVMSTPVMTNAGRYKEKPLTACTVPPVDLRENLLKVREIVDQFHADGMGTGFNLDETDKPADTLRYLNQVAVDGANSGREDRPVGNMAIISVNHPDVEQIINIKRGADQKGEEWKFNISINVSNVFMKAAKLGTPFQLADGKTVNARELLYQMAEAAGDGGDPGLIFLDRMNQDNPTPCVGVYKSTAPCAEVGLTPGESCMFGYLNLGKFTHKNGTTSIDYEGLRLATYTMTRALDNALEHSLDYLPHPTNQQVMRAKRKIGVGICGTADLLAEIGIPYDSEEGRQLVLDLTAWINYHSKRASIELAKSRGSFGAMDTVIGNRYMEQPGFIESKYSALDAKTVSAADWQELSQEIRQTKMLRNASTIALPPTGRSGMVIDASTGVEPWFTLHDYNGNIQPAVINALQERNLLSEEIESEIQKTGKIGHLNGKVPADIKARFQTALEITPQGHLGMVSVVGRAVDESISKTVNMPIDSSTQDIVDIYEHAYEQGLKGITIFVTGSRKYQPRETAK